MNNFPTMTAAQHAALIWRCEEIIRNCENAMYAEAMNEAEEMDLRITQIALAALTAEPVAYTDAEELETLRKGTFADMFTPHEAYKADPLWMPLYTAPPAPVLKPIELPKNTWKPCDCIDCVIAYDRDDVIAAIRAAGYEVKQ